jgi:hypothetical protein
MYTLQTRSTGQEYLTIWWIGCITFLTSILISLVFIYTVVPQIERLEMMLPPTGFLLFVPLSLQISFCFLFIAGLSAIFSICRWRQASLRLILLGFLPMLAVFLLYSIPQGIGDLHWGDALSWGSISVADRALLFAPHILLLTSYLFFVLSTIALVRKLRVQRRVPGGYQNWLK